MDVVEGFDWQSVYGLFLDGQHYMFQRKYELAEQKIEACLEKDPNYIPALNLMASLSFRKGAYADGLGAFSQVNFHQCL